MIEGNTSVSNLYLKILKFSSAVQPNSNENDSVQNILLGVVAVGLAIIFGELLRRSCKRKIQVFLSYRVAADAWRRRRRC